MTDDGELRARAEGLGVEPGYHDIAGDWHDAPREVLQRVVELLETDQASARERRGTTVIEPVQFGAIEHIHVVGDVTDAELVVDGMSVAVTVHPHAADDPGDWIELPHDVPAGCHTLHVATSRGEGSSTVVVAPPTMPADPLLARKSGVFVPTYALWSAADPLPSFGHLGDLARALPAHGIDVVATLPLYSSFLDEPYDPSPYAPISRLHWNETYIADSSLPAARVPALAGEVDWELIAGRRRRQLIELARLADRHTDHQLRALTTSTPDVAAYARFRAERDPSGDRALAERAFALGQLLATEQLAALRAPGAAPIALDLPIGSHPDGFESEWYPDLFTRGAALGAPPDGFFTAGQDWSFLPQLPAELRASGYGIWRDLISRVGRYADILRIDHVMAVQRLWWIPDGFEPHEGVYVRYPREELLAVIAASAAAAGVTIVGENLGTVPWEIGEAIDRWEMLGMYEEQFHLDDDPLATIPARSVAGVRTHDMAAFAAVAAEIDLDEYRSRLAISLDRAVDASSGAVLEAMLERLAASDAFLVLADLDDLLGETRPHNLPGRIVPGLWQRRFDRSVDELLADRSVAHRLGQLSRSAAAEPIRSTKLSQ